MNDTREANPVPFSYGYKGRGKTLKEFGIKLVVTDYGLAHWMAANYGYNINEFPNKNDEEIPNQFYDNVMKQWK